MDGEHWLPCMNLGFFVWYFLALLLYFQCCLHYLSATLFRTCLQRLLVVDFAWGCWSSKMSLCSPVENTNKWLEQDLLCNFWTGMAAKLHIINVCACRHLGFWGTLYISALVVAVPLLWMCCTNYWMLRWESCWSSCLAEQVWGFWANPFVPEVSQWGWHQGFSSWLDLGSSWLVVAEHLANLAVQGGHLGLERGSGIPESLSRHAAAVWERSLRCLCLLCLPCPAYPNKARKRRRHWSCME